MACTSTANLSVAFGDVLVGESATEILTISNPEAEDLDVSSVRIGGEDAALFSVDTTRFAVPSLDSRALPVGFAPNRVGTYTASLDFNCNGESVSIPLSGAGVPLLVVVTPLNAPVAGESLGLTATLPDTYLPDRQEIFYRQSGKTTYESQSVDRVDTRLTTTLPPEVVTPRGLEYYFRFSRGQTMLTVPGTNPENNPIRLRVHVDSLAAAIDLPSLQYRMISIPLELADVSVDAVLADDLGAYDSTRWRLFRWNPSAQAYAEPPGLPDTFVPGAAFWLNTRLGETLDVEAGRSVDARSPFRIPLQPGWNQIGTPYAFAVAWENVEGSDVVEAPVAYDGVEYRYGETVLEPWTGYFVFNPSSESVVLSFFPVEVNETAAKHISDAPSMHSGGFGVELIADVDGSPWRDSQNVLGMIGATPSEIEPINVTEAPGIGEHLRVSILDHGQRFAASYRPVDADRQEWIVEVALDGVRALLPQRQQVRMEIAPWGDWPDRYTVMVWDEDYGQEVNVSAGSFTMDVAPGKTRRLRVVLGSVDYAAAQRDAMLPTTASLSQNFPNPFSDNTRIEYALSARKQVMIAIYDMLGRRIRSLVNSEQEAGLYELTWDGRNEVGTAVASGVYVCRMEAENFRFTRRLIVIR